MSVRNRPRAVGKRDIENAAAMVKALGLTAVAVEAKPGLIRVLTAQGQVFTPGDENETLEEELRHFRQTNGHD